MNKKALELSFNMLFAIIVGAVILFLAVYFIGKIVDTGRYEQDTELAKKISILTNPLETGFAESKTQIIDLRLETRMYNDCSEMGDFGKNIISTTTKSGIGGKWVKPKVGIELNNKYIFSENIEEGKTLFVFSKKFEMPFYIADLIITSSNNYCFINPDYNIENEIESLSVKNIKIENCSETDISVCFNKGECDINVLSEDNYETGYIDKDDKRRFFVGNLLYPGIFSSEEIYECNIKRLMNRLVRLTIVYGDKISIIKDKCDPGIDAELLSLNSVAKALDNSDKLFLVYNSAKQLENKQSSTCEI